MVSIAVKGQFKWQCIEVFEAFLVKFGLCVLIPLQNHDIKTIKLPLQKYNIFSFLVLYIPKIIVLLQRCSPERVYAPPLEDYLKSSSCILNLLESISSLSYVTSAPFRTRVTEVMFLLLLSFNPAAKSRH